MTAAELVSSVRHNGGVLYLDGARIRYRGAQALDAHIIEQIRELKAEIVSILSAQTIEHHAKLHSAAILDQSVVVSITENDDRLWELLMPGHSGVDGGKQAHPDQISTALRQAITASAARRFSTHSEEEWRQLKMKRKCSVRKSKLFPLVPLCLISSALLLESLDCIHARTDFMQWAIIYMVDIPDWR